MAEGKYLVDPDTGDAFPIGGCLFNPEPSNLPKYGASRSLSSKHLPVSVDLRQLMTPVEHQGKINSCVGNVLAGAYEFLIMKHTDKHIKVSRLFIYYNGRLKDGLKEYNMADCGTQLRSAIDALAEFGCCKEQTYPYNLAYTNQKPPSYCYSEARNYRIVNAMCIQVHLDEMKACLAEGFPFAFGLQLFQSFLKAGKRSGRVSMPDPYHESQTANHGWHAMLAVGYSDPSQCFIVRNSWGRKWGDRGYCYIPYAYMCNTKYCGDLHAIKIVGDDCSRHREKYIPNSYDWKVDKDKKCALPEDYFDHGLHYQSFWKVNDTFNYFTTICKEIKPALGMSNKIHAKGTDHQYGHIPTTHSILWIDKKSEDIIHVVRHLTDKKNVQIDFCETLREGEEYLRGRIAQMKSFSTFQVICRGYYKHENRNSLNLLRFLNGHGLSHVPVLVFTHDKSGLQYYLDQQAPSMGISNWKKRLAIIDSPRKLVEKIEENMIDKHRNHDE